MGCSAMASCPCGYDSGELLIGQGDSGPDPCYFPAYCSEGSHLVEINMVEHPRRCPAGHLSEPVPYYDKSLFQNVGKKLVVTWGSLDLEFLVKNIGAKVVGDWRGSLDVRNQLKLTDGSYLWLTDGSYLCPACNQYTLTFREGNTMWD